jgi:serine/threonine-protein kinase RsbW
MGVGGSDKSTSGRPRQRAAGKPSHWVIPSDFVATRDIQQHVVDALERYGYSEQSTFAVKLALEEALINAIRHGNKLDRTKRVTVEAKITAKQCEITVEDEGPGFNRKSVPDPTLEENLEKCSGRGILLIEAYMNKVTWDRGGRRIKIVKYNRDDVPSVD